MTILFILAVGSNLFKKNLTFLFSSDFQVSISNSFLFIFCGILLFAISGGLFFNSISQKFNLELIPEITSSRLIDYVFIPGAVCFAFLMIRFLWASLTFFVLDVNPNIEFYFLLNLRYILIFSCVLLILVILVKSLIISDLQWFVLFFLVGSIMFLGFIVLLYKRLIYLNDNTNIPLYYIILYLCALELLPILVTSKILIVRS